MNSSLFDVLVDTLHVGSARTICYRHCMVIEMDMAIFEAHSPPTAQ